MCLCLCFWFCLTLFSCLCLSLSCCAGEDCPGCNKAEWLAKADEIIARKSAERSGSGPVPDSAAAPDGAMHMTKEEFQEQLKSSLDGVDDMPSLDGEHHPPVSCRAAFPNRRRCAQRNAWMRCGPTLPRKSGPAR